MIQLSDLRVRDPFIVPYLDMYYLYGTFGEDEDNSLYAYRSKDLENWEGPITILTLSDDFWGNSQLWAPEVHEYRGKFYVFFSILGKNGLRGTQIALADTPEGPFVPISEKAATPADQSCIDGTFYVENDIPYMVYSHDWPDHYITDGDYYLGEICAVQLSEDLTEAVGEPFLLFDSLDAPLSAKSPAVHPYGTREVKRYGSDGPFMSRMSDGSLVLLWSPIPAMNYLTLAAVSDNGSIRGRWRHAEVPVFHNNGGHAMIFKDFHGQTQLALHYNECYPNERATILPLEEVNGVWKVQE